MRTQLKSTLALVLALLICVSVFAACKGGGEGDDTSSIPLGSFASVPSEAEINTDTGEIKMAYGSTFADLKEDLQEQGQLVEGETLQLFQADQVTEITDEATPLESGMIVIKKDAEGNEVLKLTLVIEAAVTSVTVDSEGNTVIQREDGTTQTVNSRGEVISETSAPANNNSSNGVTADPSTSVATPSNTSSEGTTTPSTAPSFVIDSLVSIDSGAAESVIDDKYTLTIAGDRTDTGLVMAVLAFQDKHPNVTVRIVAPVGDHARITSLDNLKMQLASNNAPDIATIDTVYVASAGYQGYLLDLQQFGCQDVESKYIPSTWSSLKSQIAGSTAQFGLPFDCNTILQYYNKNLLDLAGVTSAPQNWEELKAALDRLKTLPDVSSPYVLCVNPTNAAHKNFAAFTWMMWLWRLGGDVLNSSLNGSTFAEQPGVDALQMYVDMVTKYNVPKEFNEGDFGAGTAGFIMYVNQHFTPNDPHAGSRNFQIGTTLLPELKAGVPRYSGLGLYALCLPNKITGAGDANQVARATAQATWAYEFIEFYSTSLEYQLSFCQSTLLMPSLVEARGQAIYTGEFWDLAYEQLALAKSRPSVKNWESIEIYIAEAINATVNGTK